MLSGLEGLQNFFGQLAVHMSGGDWSYLDFIRALYLAAPQIGWGIGDLPRLAWMFAMLCMLATLLYLPTRMVAARDRMVLVTALASVAVIYVWYALFQSHTYVHSGFMVRLLAWPIGMGPVCLLLVYASRRRPKRKAFA